MKPSFKMKPFFKQALKMLVMFVGMFMLMFTILMIVVIVTAHAAEPQTESTTSVEQTENGLEEYEEETEAPSRTGGGHHVNDTEKATDEETTFVSPASYIQDVIDSVLNSTESIDDDYTLDEDEEQVSPGNNIIVYQVSPTAESSSEFIYYGSLEEYEEGETSALTYGEYVINKKLEYICILSGFMTGFEFISMIASWRKR